MFYNNTAKTSDMIVRYNIFANATDSCLRLHGRDWTDALTMDYNCWFNRHGPLLLWDRQTVGADEFPAFMKARGLSAHAVIADPTALQRIPAGASERTGALR